jgi:RNA polymerase sigma factor (sigma-70 family)
MQMTAAAIQVRREFILEKIPDLESVPEPPPSSPPNRTQKEVADLIASVEGTVWQTAKRFSRGLSASEVEDLRSAGREGAVIAARRYDADRGANFNTYATNWIKAYVVNQMFFFRGRGRFSGRTSAGRMTFFHYGKAKQALEDQGIESTIDQIAEKLGVDVAYLASVLSIMGLPDHSFDEPLGEGNFSLADTISDERSANTLGDLLDRASIEEVLIAMERLSEREEFVIRQRYLEDKSLKEIGRMMRFSPQRVSQIEIRALERLRALLEE